MLHRIQKQLSHKKTENRHGLQITEDDLDEQFAFKKGSVLWLGRFTRETIEDFLEKSGIFPSLREKGLTDFFVELETLEDFGQALKVYSRSKSPDCLLAEVHLREIAFTPKEKMPESFSQNKPKMLAIGWLMMQNPFVEFTPDRPRLPGQEHPGLGQARRVVKLLHIYCRWQGLAALVNFPEHFHNAYLYRSHFKFYNPTQEALLTSLFRDLQPLTLAQMSWAIEWRCVREQASGLVFDWYSDIQILPVWQAIKDYFSSTWYREKTEHWIARQGFVLDKKKFACLWQN